MSSSIFEILVGSLAVALAVFYYRKFTKRGTSIPEPLSIPIFGHMFFLGFRAYYTLTKWSKTYGKIFKLKLGTVESVILSDPDLIREAFNLAVFSGRTDLKSFSAMSDGKNGIIASDSEIWVEQRRFAIRNLRDFGFGRKSMENMIMEEINESIEGFRKEVGKPVVVQQKFTLAVLNSLWQIVAGSRYSHDDPKLIEIVTRAHEVFSASSVNPILIFFPKLAELFPNISGWKSYEATFVSLRNLFREQITEHKKTFVENSPRDLIDTYLDEINKTTDPTSSFYKEMGEKQLRAVVGDFFNAGSDTTSFTLQWAVLYLSQYQDVQKKFREEIIKVVGKSSVPSLEHKSSMPYTEALIMEILRKSSIVPISLIHKVMADTEFHGYLLPKGCGIQANFYGVHHDPLVWKDPQNFRPERFIDENGECIKKHDSLMPFAVGKRACVGESLARDTVFLFLTSIFQRFEIIPEPDKDITFEAKIGFMLAPQTFKVIFNEI